jgi:hypothetical protein
MTSNLLQRQACLVRDFPSVAFQQASFGQVDIHARNDIDDLVADITARCLRKSGPIFQPMQVPSSDTDDLSFHWQSVLVPG